MAEEIHSVEGIRSVDLRGVLATRRYTTSEGESLGKIAEEVYGSSDLWEDIFQANREKIENPNRIRPFMTLTLPERDLGR